ncbi:hypothetical protein BTUL_0273g00010 [Botrytis tulipae]|uniref:Helicase C-terminal domain-containing protein n=1 Tax=Botrytis tulipae TaxID=87230 RepID=A0A4Z1E5T6_9HELO|nr:hypothetical protein BTUL_0273g00010 [Botrytis tulipae]
MLTFAITAMSDTCNRSGLTPITPHRSTSEISNEIAKDSKHTDPTLEKNKLVSNLVDNYNCGNNDEILKDGSMDSVTPEKSSHRKKGSGLGQADSPDVSEDQATPTKTVTSSDAATPSTSQAGTPTPSAPKRRGRPVTRPPRTPKKAIEKIATSQERRYACENNPTGVNVVGSMNVIAKMAGYIRLNTTREAHDLYHTPYFEDLLENFIEKKEAGFGDFQKLPKSQGYRSVIIWKYLRSLSDIEWTCIRKYEWPTTKNTELEYPAFGYHCWIRTLYWIIKSGHAGFHVINDIDQFIRGITVENWNRAFSFLRVWVEMPNKNAMKDTDRKKPGFAAILPEYLTADDIDRFKNKNGKDYEEKRTQKQPYEIFQAEILKRDMAFHCGEAVSNRPITYEDFVFRVSMLKEPGIILGNRPAITIGQAKEFLFAMKDKCRVIHDGFRSMSESGKCLQSDAIKNAVETDNVAKAIERPSHIKEDSFYKSLEQIEEFWSKMKNVSTISVETPTFNDAYIAWMCLQEDSPMRGGIVANECGLGKTIEIYGLIHEQSLAAIKRHRELGSQFGVKREKYRPTLVLVPSTVIGVHLKDSDLRTEGVRELDSEGEIVRELSEGQVSIYFNSLKNKEALENDKEVDSDDEAFIDNADLAENPDMAEEKFDNSIEIFSKVENLFDRICLDEGHAAKNSKTRIHQAVLMVHAYHHWMISATPMMNRIEDLHGILNLLWREEWRIKGDYDEIMSYQDDFDAANMLDPNCPSYKDVLRRRLWRLDPGEPTVRIRDQIPPLTTRVIELDPDEDFEKGYDEFYQLYAEKLGSAKEMKNESYAKILENRQEPRVSADRVGIDLRVHRKLCHGTFTPLLEILTQRLEKSTVTQVNEWFTLNNDNGASFFFRMTRHNYFDPLPTTRLPLAFYMAAICPKIKWIGGYLAEHALGEKREREFLSSVTGQYHFGFAILSIRSEMNMVERQAAADKFNDPEERCDVMFVGGRLGALGLNFQMACHRVIIAEQFDKINLDLQAAGRVGRLKQKNQQDVIQLYLHHSYDSILLRRKTKKFEKQIAGEGFMDPCSPLTFDEQRENITRDVLGLRLRVSKWEGRDYYAWDDEEQDEPQSSTGYTYKLSPIAEAKKLERCLEDGGSGNESYPDDSKVDDNERGEEQDENIEVEESSIGEEDRQGLTQILETRDNIDELAESTRAIFGVTRVEVDVPIVSQVGDELLIDDFNVITEDSASTAKSPSASPKVMMNATTRLENRNCGHRPSESLDLKSTTGLDPENEEV